MGFLLDQVEGPLASFTGDGAYDQEGVTSSVTERHPEAAIIVPPRTTAVPSDTAETAPTQRDRHLQHIAKHGRMAWQTASGCTKRAKAETGMSRFKQVIGDGLRSHTDERQATEVNEDEVGVDASTPSIDTTTPHGAVLGGVSTRLSWRVTLFSRRAPLTAAANTMRGTSGPPPWSALPCRIAQMNGDQGWVMSCRTTWAGVAADKAAACRRGTSGGLSQD